MANDILGGLGGLMKGLSGFMPQDDPSVKMISVQSEVAGLEKQESELYAEIGRSAVKTYGLDAFGSAADKLRLVQSNLADAREKLEGAKSRQAEKEKAEKEQKDACTCPECGHVNPEGTKFCQECGSKIGAAAKTFCVECGAPLTPGIKFCGECGTKQPE